MDVTNIEDENSDAAVFGLVALRDPVDNSQDFPEEVVETSCQVVAAEVVGDSSVQIFIQTVSDNINEQKSLPTSNEVSAAYALQEVADGGVCIDKKQFELHLVEGWPNQQQSTDDKKETLYGYGSDHHNNENKTSDEVNSFLKEGDYIIDSLNEVANAGLNDAQFVVGSISDEVDEGKILMEYTDVPDVNCIQVIKTRQSLMREAVEWKVYARMLLEKGCSEGANFYEPEVATVLKATDDVVVKAEILSRITEKDMLQPSVQFWDFEKIYVMYGAEKPLNCPSCNSQLVFVAFGQRFALRMLYDLDKPVLLVTSFLRCSNKGKKQHEILGYDPRLLRMFPNLDLPFMLFHKAGITKRMMEFIMNSVINGMTVNRLYDVIKTKYEVHHTISSQFFVNEIDSIREHVTAAGGQIEVSTEAMFPPYVNCHPSKALLNRCFLASFKEKDEYYKFCMHQLLANECIILDDSLFVGTRIGMSGVWGQQGVKLFPEEYKGVLLVFNEAKHIISWEFLKDVCFAEVQFVLSEVRERHIKANKSLKACFTTKCCDWRDDLRQMFGKWFIVKGNLRLFLDWIVKELPSEHVYFQNCVIDLAMVFRGPNDNGEQRIEYTPDSLVIAQNLKDFVKRWQEMTDSQIEPMLSEKSLEMLAQLEKHVQAGCLSNIPPEVGDENFSDVHNALRKSISYCRITVPLVSAMFSMCIHEINKKKGAAVDFKYKSDCTKVVTPSNQENVEVSVEGMTTVSIQTENKPSHLPAISTIRSKQQILPASEVIIHVHNYYSKSPVPRLLLQALMYYKYQEDFDAFSPQSISNLRLLPYYSSALNLISHPAFPKEEPISDDEQISQGVLQVKQKIRRLRVDASAHTRDLHALFARQLTKEKMSENLSVDALEYVKFLVEKDLRTMEKNEEKLKDTLKKITGKDNSLANEMEVVLNDDGCKNGEEDGKQEGNRTNNVVMSVTENKRDEADDFNLLKKMADELGAVVTLITNLEHCWLIPVFPAVFNLFSPHFFLIYRYRHFFPASLSNRASVSSIRNINLKRQGKDPQCRCGRGTPGKDDQAKCVSKDKGKYMTRCICFRLDRACGALCDCRCCENPFGKKPHKTRNKKVRIPYRQRYAHEAAKFATCKSSALATTIATQTLTQFDTGEDDLRQWVPVEHSIFESLINEIKSEENAITPEEVQEAFNAIVDLMIAVKELSNVAQKKTSEEIAVKLQQRERDVAEYLKIYQMQVDLSLS